MPTLRPLLLTGGPAAGKSTTARRLAEMTPRTAHVDVDDVRHFVKSGHAAPWEGVEGAGQQSLGVRNAAALAANFTDDGFNVVISDVVNRHTVGLYRQLLPTILIARLIIDVEQARTRAATRPIMITDAEFENLHGQQDEELAVDVEIDVSRLSIGAQLQAVRVAWLGTGQTIRT